MKDFPGIPLSEKEFEKAFKTEWRAKAVYSWDTGIALSKFLQGLKEGKILGRKCFSCTRVVVPPRMFCEHCFRPNDEWVELKDTGVINTFSICFVNWDASRREKPQIPAVIEIDGASKNIGILHLIGEVGETIEAVLKNLKIGMKVQAVWKKPEERKGEITDILYFKPLKK